MKTKGKKFDFVGSIMAYETGELGDKDTLDLFLYLLNTGRAWTLQGHYGRTAQALLDDKWIVKTEAHYVEGVLQPGAKYKLNEQKIKENGIE